MTVYDDNVALSLHHKSATVTCCTDQLFTVASWTAARCAVKSVFCIDLNALDTACVIVTVC